MTSIRAPLILACGCCLVAAASACQRPSQSGRSGPADSQAAPQVTPSFVDGGRTALEEPFESPQEGSPLVPRVRASPVAPARTNESTELGAPSEAAPENTTLAEVQLAELNPSVYVEPLSNVARPAPLIVVLHGNFDRPEWECETWRQVASSRAWLLCPRGYPRTDVDPDLDRWTYHGRGKLAVEITRGVDKLRELHPDQISVEGAILIGLSLGANMAPRLASMKVLPFRALVLVEGGYQVDDAIARGAARKGIERVVYVCGERTACPGRVAKLQRIWKRAGIGCQTYVMPGAGHEYGAGFDEIALRALDFVDGERSRAPQL